MQYDYLLHGFKLGMMAKFRKKPVEIEAVQLRRDNENEMSAHIKGLNCTWGIEKETKEPHIIIPTLEGEMLANENDWIIKGVNGEYYPCKPDIFEKAYDAVL